MIRITAVPSHRPSVSSIARRPLPASRSVFVIIRTGARRDPPPPTRPRRRPRGSHALVIPSAATSKERPPRGGGGGAPSFSPARRQFTPRVPILSSTPPRASPPSPIPDAGVEGVADDGLPRSARLQGAGTCFSRHTRVLHDGFSWRVVEASGRGARVSRVTSLASAAALKSHAMLDGVVAICFKGHL